MLGQCALLSYLNPGAALAFPKLQEVNKDLLLICFVCFSVSSQTVTQKIRGHPFLFFVSLILSLFPTTDHFHVLTMAAGARTCFGTTLLSQTRITSCSLPKCFSPTLPFLSWVSFSCMGSPASLHSALLWNNISKPK